MKITKIKIDLSFTLIDFMASPSLQMTFLPPQYWNDPSANFTLFAKNVELPTDAGFFFLWSYPETIVSENFDQSFFSNKLDRIIEYYFPEIPVKKLVSGSIRLVLPNLNNQNQTNQNDKINKNRDNNNRINLENKTKNLGDKFLPIKQVYGKLLPIPPALKILFKIKIAYSKARTQQIKQYPDAIKIWSLLTKFAFELIHRGNFLPVLEEEHKFGNYNNSGQVEIQNNTYKSENNIDINNSSIQNYNQLSNNFNKRIYRGSWRVVLRNQSDHKRFADLIANSGWSAYNIPFNFIPIIFKNTNPTNSTDPTVPTDSTDSTDSNQEINNKLEEKHEYYTDAVWHPSFLFIHYMDLIADYFIRSSVTKKFLKKFAQSYHEEVDETLNACTMSENAAWDYRFLNACITKEKSFEINRFCDTPIPGILRNWVQTTQGFSYDLGVVFAFRLDYPKTPKSDWVFGYYIQPMHDSNTLISLREIWNGNITQKAEFANVCDDNNELQEEILRALGTANKLFPPIKRSLHSRNPYKVSLKTNEVMDLLRYSKELLTQAGFKVILPEQFQGKGQYRLSAQLIIKPMKKLNVHQDEDKNTMVLADKIPSISKLNEPAFSMQTIAEFHWEARLEGNKLTESEFLELAKSNEPLVYWRDQWILVDKTDMETLKPIFSEALESDGLENKRKKSSINNLIDGFPLSKIKGELTASDVIQLGLLGEIKLPNSESKFEVKLEGDLEKLIDKLQHIASLENITPSANFKGILRPYQQKALTWLYNMSEIPLGVCLADDMGLGKTIETIAFLAKRQELYPNVPGSTLIVCPTSVLTNWERELNKFAPSLPIIIYHGADRISPDKLLNEFTKPHLVILTTYGTLRNDIEHIKSIPFATIILDESQNIKNYKTQQTKAVYQLQGSFRLALSGTPIENHLIELWTLFNFLNPGLLGTRTQFQRNYVLPIERYHNTEIAEKLHQFIKPFILRRVKTDKSIISDLPEKNEMKIYLDLTPIQQKLYSKIVAETLKEIESEETTQIKRKGLILKLLTQTKQICNHPYQYLHKEPPNIDLKEINDGLINIINIDSNNSYSNSTTEIKNWFSEFSNNSMKVNRLQEMIEEVLEEGEKLIIFTQFTQMGSLLQIYLTLKYGFKVLFYHGGLTRKVRQKIIDDFQSSDLDSPPILILSLKAGGTGLNLTQATTVFHFDRWWNPAVENQATDRVYRIGQKHQVNVFKFISVGTVEEKIDRLLEEKQNLANQIIQASGENWITELSTEELRDLFEYSRSNKNKR